MIKYARFNGQSKKLTFLFRSLFLAEKKHTHTVCLYDIGQSRPHYDYFMDNKFLDCLSVVFFSSANHFYLFGNNNNNNIKIEPGYLFNRIGIIMYYAWYRVQFGGVYLCLCLVFEMLSVCLVVALNFMTLWHHRDAFVCDCASGFFLVFFFYYCLVICVTKIERERERERLAGKFMGKR